MNRGKVINVNKNEKVLAANIHNRFDIEVIDANTGKIKQKAEALNTICDNLWTWIFSEGGRYFRYIQYGTGSGVPSSSDKSLFSFLGYKQAEKVSDGISRGSGVYTLKRKITLSTTEAVGKTLTEVGIAAGTSSSLCTHAMLQDMNGNPVSIQKSDTDIINIYATIYIHFNPTGYDNGCINFVTSNLFYYWLSGRYYSSSNDFQEHVFRVAYMDHYGGLGYDDDMEYRAASNKIRVDLARNFNLETKTLTITASRVEGTSVPGGIRTISLGSYTYSNVYGETHEPCMIIQSGGSWFPYSEVIGEAIGTGDGSTKDFGFDFGFVRDAVIYIDGVEVPLEEFTVDYGPFTTNNWIMYMEGILVNSSTPNSLIKNYYSRNVRISKNSGFYAFYNPLYEIGLKSYTTRFSYIKMYASNDLENWYQVGTLESSSNNSTTYTIDEQYQHYKFWKWQNESTGTDDIDYLISVSPLDTFTGSKLHFVNPPAKGAVITADYKCDCIAKDENNVFDFSMTIKVGEYVEG